MDGDDPGEVRLLRTLATQGCGRRILAGGELGHGRDLVEGLVVDELALVLLRCTPAHELPGLAAETVAHHRLLTVGPLDTR